MIVLDTDVVVAALRSPTGASAEIVRSVLKGERHIAVSVAMVLEYEAVATRPEHLAASGLTAAQALAVIDALVAKAQPVMTHFRWRPQLRDADDEMVLEAAVNGRASAIVTFNRRDFTAAARFGIAVHLPAELLEKQE